MGGLHAAAAVAAVIWVVAAALSWRAGRLKLVHKLVSLVGVVGLALYACGVFDSLPSLLDVLERISSTLGKWTYLLVGVLAFLETGAFVGLVAPGESAVIIGGVVAGQGDVDIRLLIGIVWFAAFLGDSVSYWLGHKLGREFLVRHGPKVKITEARLHQVESYMRDHGGKTILIGRFIGLVRAIAPFIAGSSRMKYRSFVPYDIIGSGLWAATFCLLGYIFSNNLEAVIHWAERGALIFGWTVGTLVVVIYLVRRFRHAEEREKLARQLREQEDKGGWRAALIGPLRHGWQRVVAPVLRFFGPQLRFAWNRLTPGELGLEFTTTMAILVTGAYTLYFFTAAALSWPTDFTERINDAAFRLGDSIRSDWLDTLAELITHLGSFPVAAVASLVAAAWCVRHRRPLEAGVLVLSMLLAVLLVTPMKAWIDLPRPEGSLVGTLGASYPSGHAAYAVAWVSVAVTFERVRDPITRTAIVIAAGALTTVIALSRVYLRAHYLTDVIGGVALMVTITSTLAAIAFLITHIRRLRREASASSTGIVD